MGAGKTHLVLPDDRIKYTNGPEVFNGHFLTEYTSDGITLCGLSGAGSRLTSWHLDDVDCKRCIKQSSNGPFYAIFHENKAEADVREGDTINIFNQMSEGSTNACAMPELMPREIWLARRVDEVAYFIGNEMAAGRAVSRDVLDEAYFALEMMERMNEDLVND